MTKAISELGEFWALASSVWEIGVFGRSIGELLIALAIFGAFYVLRGLFARYLLSILERWTSQTKNKIDDTLHGAVVDPLKFLFLILGVFFAVKYLAFSEPLNSSLKISIGH